MNQCAKIVEVKMLNQKKILLNWGQNMTIKGEMFSGIHQIQLSTLICIFTYSIDVSDFSEKILFKHDN